MESEKNPHQVCVVVGSSRVGQATIEALINKFSTPLKIRAVVRSLEKASLLTARFGGSVEVVSGVDAFDKGSHERAFSGVEKALIVAPQLENREDAVNNLLDSAKEHGVRHVVLIGGVFQEEEKFLFHRQWMSSRRRALTLGLKWTQLECSDFMENLYRSQKSVQEEGKIHGAGAEGVSAPVALVDIGEAAAVILSEPGDIHYDKGYRIVGGDIFTPSLIAEIFTRTLGKQVVFVDTGIDSAREAAIKSGAFPRWQSEGFYDWMQLYFVSGRLKDVVSDLPGLGITPTRLQDWLEDRKHDFM
eukprot:jgi/Mesen1/6778/ME000348S06044